MYSKTNVLFLVTLTLFVTLTQSSVVKEPENKPKPEPPRSKRESVFASPIYYDPVPQQAVQPAPGTPALTQQPQSPVQPQQGVPLFGALIPGLNGLSTLVPLGNLGNLGLGNLGLGNLGLGNLGLGNLGLPNLGLPNLGLPNLGLPNLGLPNLGNLLGGNGGLTNLGGVGNVGVPGAPATGLPGLGNIGGLLPGPVQGLLPGQATQRCPVTQTLNCRCENILPLPVQPTARSSDNIEILQQNIKLNANGDKEISAHLSNGISLYQRSGIETQADNKKSKVLQGHYSLKLENNKYLNLYYTVNDLDYTVKADVTAEPPQNDLDAAAATT